MMTGGQRSVQVDRMQLRVIGRRMLIAQRPDGAMEITAGLDGHPAGVFDVDFKIDAQIADGVIAAVKKARINRISIDLRLSQRRGNRSRIQDMLAIGTLDALPGVEDV